MKMVSIYWHLSVYTDLKSYVMQLDLRRKFAMLLGYKNWAEYCLEVRMTRNPEKVGTRFDSPSILFFFLLLLGISTSKIIAPILDGDV